MNKKIKGFTLVELLATIIVLGVLITIVVYVVTNIISRSKEKSYLVTISEIEGNAHSYLVENNDRLYFIEGEKYGQEYEYQCITIENLVDYGYLKSSITNSKVNENTNVLLADYVYIERNINTKAIEITEFVNKDSPYYELCGGAIIAQKESAIKFLASPGFNEWSTYKDITIIYNLKNLNDVRTVGEYEYNHEYTADSEYNQENDTIEGITKTKKVRVLDNGKMSADIKLGNKLITSASKTINRVDIIGPVVRMGNYTGNKVVSRKVTIPLKVTDFGIGVDYPTFTKEDIKVTVGNQNIDSFELEQVKDENYSITINNTLYDGEIILEIEKDTIFDTLKNGNLDMTKKNNTQINTGISFNNIYMVITNRATISVKSQTNTTITSQTEESKIYVDPYN